MTWMTVQVLEAVSKQFATLKDKLPDVLLPTESSLLCFPPSCLLCCCCRQATGVHSVCPPASRLHHRPVIHSEDALPHL